MRRKAPDSLFQPQPCPLHCGTHPCSSGLLSLGRGCVCPARSSQEGPTLLKASGEAVTATPPRVPMHSARGGNSPPPVLPARRPRPPFPSPASSSISSSSSKSKPSYWGTTTAEHVTKQTPCPELLSKEDKHIPKPPTLREIKPTGSLHPSPQSISPALSPWAVQLIGKQFSPSPDVAFP